MKNKKLKKTNDIYFFRKWSNKGFGVFRTQGKQIAISTMIMAGSLTFETSTLYAQTDSVQQNPVHQLDEVIINGEEEPLLFSKMARIVTVLNQNDIEAAPVSDLNELLEYATGLDIKQRGIKGVQADISLRGGTFDQTLILLNGVNITDPQTGHHNLNLPIDLQSIDRIEILSGPASRIFGVNAFNGAINIITKPEAQTALKLNASIGQYGYLHQNATLKTGKKWKQIISGSHKQSNGYLPNEDINNTDFNSSTIFYHGNLEKNGHAFDFLSGYNQKAFGANSFYTPAFPEQFEATNTIYSSLKYKWTQNKLKTGANIYYRRHQDRFELFRDTAPDWYTNHNHHLTDVAGGNIPFMIKTKIGVFSTNASLRYAHIYSNILGQDMSGSKKVPGQNARFTKQDERFHSSIQANYSFNTAKLHFAAGLMTSHYNILKRTRTYPGVEISYQLIDKLNIFSSYNEALRLPTFTDLYYNGPTNIGDPNLKPEESKTIEGGLKYVSSIIRIQSAIFYRKGKNIIEWVKPLNAPGDVQWQTQNLTELNTLGVDFDLTAHFTGRLKNDFIQNISLNYSWLDQKNSNNEIESKYVADFLRHQISLRLTHRIIKKLVSTWGISWQDRAGKYLTYENNSYQGEKSYKPTTLVNWKIAWEEENWSIFAEASNLLNQTYFDISNVPQPGRWLQIGAKYTLQKL